MPQHSGLSTGTCPARPWAAQACACAAPPPPVPRRGRHRHEHHRQAGKLQQLQQCRDVAGVDGLPSAWHIQPVQAAGQGSAKEPSRAASARTAACRPSCPVRVISHGRRRAAARRVAPPAARAGAARRRQMWGAPPAPAPSTRCGKGGQASGGACCVSLQPPVHAAAARHPALALLAPADTHPCAHRMSCGSREPSNPAKAAVTGTWGRPPAITAPAICVRGRVRGGSVGRTGGRRPGSQLGKHHRAGSGGCNVPHVQQPSPRRGSAHPREAARSADRTAPGRGERGRWRTTRRAAGGWQADRQAPARQRRRYCRQLPAVPTHPPTHPPGQKRRSRWRRWPGLPPQSRAPAGATQAGTLSASARVHGSCSSTAARGTQRPP